MKKFISDVKSSLKKLDDKTTSSSSQVQNNQQKALFDPSDHNPTLIMAPPSPDDVLRYRYHHGTNVGSVFVLEAWLTGSMFPAGWTGKGAELDAVLNHQRANGPDRTREKWEAHWRNAISDEQFRWLAVEAKCTSIRLPIGYFTLGPQWCNDTPFAEVAGVYANAWAAVREITRRAKDWGIGTLIDFHAVYGGANGEEHSGTLSGRAELWTDRRNQERATNALSFIADQVKTGALSGVVGIQLCNEAIHNANNMYGWYDEVIRAIGRVDESIPIYISDGWNLETCLQWVTARNTLNTSPRNPVIIDTHKYYTFSDADKAQSPQQIIGRLPGEFQEIKKRDGGLLSSRGEAQVIVGEYSCVLDGQTWGRVPGDQKEGFVKQFGQAQCRAWCEKTGGSYFWTYKMDWMPGGEWGFEDQTRKGNVVPPNFLTISSGDVLNRVGGARDRKGQLAGTDRGNHENYWNSTSPGKAFQHNLYSDGWERGYSDALDFFKMRAEGALGGHARDIGGGDKIGCLDVWIKKRLLESNARGEFVWEWEQGFRKGVSTFYSTVGF